MRGQIVSIAGEGQIDVAALDGCGNVVGDDLALTVGDYRQFVPVHVYVGSHLLARRTMSPPDLYQIQFLKGNRTLEKGLVQKILYVLRVHKNTSRPLISVVIISRRHKIVNKVAEKTADFLVFIPKS